MTRLFLSENLHVGQQLTIGGEQAHYLLRVVRCRPGERLALVDATGQGFEAAVEACGPEAVEVRIVAVRAAAQEASFELDLFPALLKGRRIELVIQKCTELGVARIVPIITERTISRPEEERTAGRVQRWRTIALEASRQCGRAKPPEVKAPASFAEALERVRASGIPGLLPYEGLAGDAEASLGAALAACGMTVSVMHESHPCMTETVMPRLRGRLAVFIGPEGGFSAGEVELARAAGLRTVSLGPRVLRAETASIAACAIILYEMDRCENSPQE